MQQNQLGWSAKEKALAQDVFKRAYGREIRVLLEQVREQATALAEAEDIWQLHDFLSARRHDIDGKYDDRESSLIFAFAMLLKDGLLSLDELEGLAADKLAKVSALSRM
ncbi:MAG: hypothetical protein AAF215_12725 [Cyanobacteria bacterium P01_A01_bin.123]